VVDQRVLTAAFFIYLLVKFLLVLFVLNLMQIIHCHTMNQVMGTKTE